MSYSSEVLADSPIAYWRLGEASGTSAADASGNGRTGTYLNTPTLGVAGALANDANTAATFASASSEEMTAAFWAGLNLATFTLECWVKTTATNQAIMGRQGAGSTPYCMFVDAAGKLQLVIKTSGTSGTNYSGSGTINNGAWRHVVIVRNAAVSNTLYFYIAGVLDATTPSSVVPNVATSFGFAIASRGASAFLNGSVDEVAVYNTALSAARIASHFAAGSPAKVGHLDGDLGHLEGGFSGLYDGPIAGSLDGELGHLEGAFTGTYASPPATGILDGDLPGAQGDFTGTYQNSVATGTLDGVLPGGLQAGLYGRYRGQIATDTSNAFDGRSRGGGALLSFNPPTAELPAGALVPDAVVKAMAFPFPTLVDGNPTWDQNDLVELEKPQGQDLVQVAGKDLTRWRMTEPDDVPTKVPGFELTDPFAYGPSEMLFVPRIAGYFERPGQGELWWAKEWATVRYKRRTASGIKVDYCGVVVGIKPAPDGLWLDVAGELSGRAAAILRPAPPARRVQDLGQWAAYALGTLHKHLSPTRGPVTGIEIPDGGGSGMTHESWMAHICTMSQTRAGDRRTIMPKTWGKDLWELRLQDLTTVHYTGFAEGDWISCDLLDDALEQPNRFYGSGITPSGTRWRNTVFPNYIQGDPPVYPMPGGAPFGIGTTDEDTINGDGIAVLWLKFRALGWISWTIAFPGEYDQRIADLVEDVQDAAGIEETGIMTPATWNAVFDLEVTGYQHGARVEPLIQDPAIPMWLHGANGGVIGRNPRYDRLVQPVDRIIDFDTGVTKNQARDWIRGERRRTNAKNWAGRITLTQVGLWAGRVDDIDISGLTESDIVAPAEIRPGKNLWLPHFDGGTLFHIAKVKLSEDRQSATLTVDTQGRDFLELAALMARNREARRSLRRAWLAANQPGRQTGNLVIRDEHFGILDEDKTLDGDIWNVFPVVIGQMGTVNEVLVRTTNRPAQYCLAFFTHRPTRQQLQSVIGNPLKRLASGESVWEQDSLNAFFRKYVRLYVAGTAEQPCGFGDKKGYFSDGKRTSHPLTGRHEDTAIWSYLADGANDPVIWCAMYPDRATTVEAGQMLWAVEDDVT